MPRCRDRRVEARTRARFPSWSSTRVLNDKASWTGAARALLASAPLPGDESVQCSGAVWLGWALVEGLAGPAPRARGLTLCLRVARRGGRKRRTRKCSPEPSRLMPTRHGTGMRGVPRSLTATHGAFLLPPRSKVSPPLRCKYLEGYVTGDTWVRGNVVLCGSEASLSQIQTAERSALASVTMRQRGLAWLCPAGACPAAWGVTGGRGHYLPPAWCSPVGSVQGIRLPESG